MLTTLATCAFLLGPLSCLAAPASNSSTYPSTTGNSTNLWPPGGNTPFPSQAQITTIFNYLVDGQSEHFLAHILPTVNWTIEGTHPLAGEYHNATYFTENALARLDNLASPQDPLEVALVNVIGGGNQDWSASELHIFGTVKNGLKFDNRYSWNTRWNPQCQIVQARAYLDSELVARAVIGNEDPLYTSSDVRSPS